MKKLHAELIALTEARYNTQNGVRVHDKDPRNSEGFEREWDKTYDWFPWRSYEDGEARIVLWVECGYGHYALTKGDSVLGMGKDVVNTKDYTLVGESASQDGEIYLARNLIRIA